MVITAKRAAEICREWYVAFRNKGKGEEKCVLELLDVADTIEALEEAQPKWIPVTERLPNDKEKVVTYKNGIISIQIYEKKRNVWIQDGWFWSMATVTHWMPLPDAPK